MGRNAIAAERLIAECRSVCPGGVFRFVKVGDLALLRDVDGVCKEVRRFEEMEGGGGRVDVLVMSQADFALAFQGRRGWLFALFSTFSRGTWCMILSKAYLKGMWQIRKKASTHPCPSFTTRACASSSNFSRSCSHPVFQHTSSPSTPQAKKGNFSRRTSPFAILSCTAIQTPDRMSST